MKLQRWTGERKRDGRGRKEAKDSTGKGSRLTWRKVTLQLVKGHAWQGERSPYIPWVNYGLATMGGGAMGFGSSDALCLNSTKSWELAIAPISVAIPFNSQRTFGMSFGMQLAWMKVHFKDDYAMFNEDGTLTVRPIEYGEGDTFKKSYVSYTALRFPVYLEYQCTINHREIFATIGCSVEWRSGEHSHCKTAINTITPSKDIFIPHIGLNLELQKYTRVSRSTCAHRSHR
ncbi:MAG: hypothetical protein K2G12_08485 [Prevotella sp.]|nr:hypothetical protein [Prevotella sp.]